MIITFINCENFKELYYNNLITNKLENNNLVIKEHDSLCYFRNNKDYSILVKNDIMFCRQIISLFGESEKKINIYIKSKKYINELSDFINEYNNINDKKILLKTYK